MTRHRPSAEETLGLQQLASAQEAGFTQDLGAAWLAVDIANGIIDEDPDAWEMLKKNPKLTFEIMRNLRAEGRSDLIPAVNRVRVAALSRQSIDDLNEVCSIPRAIGRKSESVKENVFFSRDEDIYFYHHRRNHVRITGSELRQIIKEELRRVMREDDKPTAYKVQTLDSMELEYTFVSGVKRGDKFTGTVTFDESAQPDSFRSTDGKKFEFASDSPMAPAPYKNKILKAELTVVKAGGLEGLADTPTATVKLIDNLKGPYKV